MNYKYIQPPINKYSEKWHIKYGGLNVEKFKNF